MNEILTTWHLPALSILLVCGAGLTGTLILDKTLARMNGAITSPHDLGLLKRAINLNMKFAVLVMVLFVAYFGALVWCYAGGRIGLNLLSLYLLASGLPTYACNTLYIKKVEARAKSLPVNSDDPQVSATYRSFIEQWGKPGLSVS